MNGPRLVYCMLVALLLLCVAPMIALGLSEGSLRWAISRSVDLAIPCFLLAFSASPLNRFWPTSASRWAMRNRRYLGINWGIAFLFHGALIGLLAVLYPEPFRSTLNKEVVTHGLIAFSITALMLITSNNISIRLLHRKVWSALHTAGGYFLLLTLLGAMMTNFSKPWLWPFAAATVLLVLLRLCSALHRLWLWMSRAYRKYETPVQD